MVLNLFGIKKKHSAKNNIFCPGGSWIFTRDSGGVRFCVGYGMFYPRISLVLLIFKETSVEFFYKNPPPPCWQIVINKGGIFINFRISKKFRRLRRRKPHFGAFQDIWDFQFFLIWDLVINRGNFYKKLHWYSSAFFPLNKICRKKSRYYVFEISKFRKFQQQKNEILFRRIFSSDFFYF